MPFFFLLILIIAIAHAAEISRVTKKKKGNGSGSWDTFFDCQGGILIARGNETYKNEATGKFYAKEVVLPTTEPNKSGFCFDMDKTPGPTLQIVMDKVTDKKWCFTYRRMSTISWTYDNPSMGFKYLLGWMTTDAGVSYKIRINLPYAYTTWYINDQEGEKIAHYLNVWKAYAHVAMINAKKEASKCGNAYITNVKLLEAAKGSADSLNAEKLKIQNELASFEKRMADEKAKLQTKEDEISSLLEQVQKLRNEKSHITEITNSLSQDQIAKTDALKKLEAYAGDKKKAQDGLNLEVAKSQQCVDTQMVVLETQAPQTTAKAHWKAAKEAVITKRVIDVFLSEIGKVFP